MRFQTLCSLLAAGLVAGVLACGDEVSFPVLPAEEFTATLSGANEVPAVTTGASGTAVFAVVQDTIFSFRLDVAAIDSPTVAHIHEGAAGVIGGVIVTLYSGPTRGLAYSGPLGSGQRKPGQLTQLPLGYGATARERFDSLLVLMRTGNAYVNAHTRANPGGELRAQVQLQ